MLLDYGVRTQSRRIRNTLWRKSLQVKKDLSLAVRRGLTRSAGREERGFFDRVQELQDLDNHELMRDHGVSLTTSEEP